MPKNDNVGLSLQEAWAESMGDEDAPTSESVSQGSETPETPEVSEVEQPTVENSEEKKGLFSNLADEGQVEQSQSELHTVTVRGETLQVSLDELKNGYQRQEDYTRDKQEIARQKEENDKAITLYNALKENPVDTVRRLWEKVSQGQPVETSTTPQVSADANDIDAIVQAKVQEALANDPRVQAFENQSIKAEIDAMFKSIESDWGIDPLTDQDKQIVLEEAEKSGVYDLEAVFAKLMHKQQKFNAQVTNVESNSTSQGYGGAQSVGIQPKPASERFTSVRDAINATLVEEGMSESDLNLAIAQL